jgi:sulfite reductase (NADPH) flavoprotein alpha-component
MESQLLRQSALDQGDRSPRASAIEVVYGSQTGNAEGVARRIQTEAAQHGIAVNVTELNEFGVEALTQVPFILVLCSTYNEGNEGDMPDNAVVFWRALLAADAPPLNGLRYSVLALGDDGYFDFCHAGLLIDERLAELGAERLADRVDCDIYFEEAAEQWTAGMLELLAPEVQAGEPESVIGPPGAEWNRRNPFEARLVAHRRLSKDGSQKEVRHYELDLTGSGIDYAAGDSINVQPENDPELVELLLRRLALDPNTVIESVPLREQLSLHWEIRTPSLELIDLLAARDPEGELAQLLDDRNQLETILYGRDVLDLLDATPLLTFTPEELPGLFRPLQARQFSIASSPLVKPDSVEITVATIRHGEDRERRGVASTFLADRTALGETVRVYPQPNASFRLPADDTSVILIGPGTGIAPFRAFVQERKARASSGNTWLFFGDRSRSTDYLYEDEITAWLEDGTLTRLDLAFSRDQPEKDYVQSHMRRAGAELFDWLEHGASVYVCGDAERMAKDVEEALLDVIAAHGKRDVSAAKTYLDDLIVGKRYLRDVY